MIAVISDDTEEVDYLGYLFNYGYHAECLVHYALKKYPAITGFQKLNYMDDPNSPIYYLTLLDNIIFTNVSVDNEKRGILYLPKKISDKQLQTLYLFLDKIIDYDICIVYDMNLVDGMTYGKSFDFDEKININDKLDKFINQWFKEGEYQKCLKK